LLAVNMRPSSIAAQSARESYGIVCNRHTRQADE
jgi:hypothetical protein